MKIVKYLEKSNFMSRGFSETIEKKAKEQKMWISYDFIKYIRC